MGCIDPKMKKLVNQYQFDLLPEEDKIKVEAHLLECESCFQELYCLSPALDILEKVPDRFVDAVQSRETILQRVILFFTDNFIPAISNWWKRPAAKILIPATVTILLLVIFVLPTTYNYSDLAIIEKAPYEAIKFKGPVELSPVQQLFDEAMIFYEQDDYANTIQKLNKYLEKEPANIYGHFYLGVCFILENKIENGIDHLTTTSTLSQQEDNTLFLEKSYWYLGNAYLQMEKEQDALLTFQKTVELEGEFACRAEEQIKKIEDLKNKKDRK